MFTKSVAFTITAWALCGAVGAIRRWHFGDRHHYAGGGDDGAKWIRLCTLVSDGGSVVNVTMPCGVQVQPAVDEKGGAYNGNVVSPSLGDQAENRHHDNGRNITEVKDDSGRNATAVEDDGPYSSGSRLGTTASVADGEGVEYDENDDDYDGVTVTEATEDARTPEGPGSTASVTAMDAGPDSNDSRLGATTSAADDEGVVYDENDDDDGVTIQAQEDVQTPGEDGGDDDGDIVAVVHDEPDGGHQVNGRHGAVAKALLAYLLQARQRLHGKIHDLLSFLQHAFFNAKFNHRSRRNLAEQILVNGRRQRSKKKQSITSMIFEPTFERSLMTMSFLMFGVFVIQVVQRLMQTLQKSGEIMSMGNAIIGNLPTVSSNIV